MQLSGENTARRPNLEADEVIAGRGEVQELHGILLDVLPRFRKRFRMIRVSGLQTLFENHGLEAAFLEEGEKSLYPDSDGLSEGAHELCPNPWTTLFVTENGDARLCFLSQPIGNLYSEPLSALWNSPKAMATRSDLISGRYLASGCSRQYCGWREGNSSPPRSADAGEPEWRELAENRSDLGSEIEAPGALALVRRLVAGEDRRRIEREVYTRSLEALLEAGQSHINNVEAKAERAVLDFRNVEAEFRQYRASWLVRAAHKASEVLGAWRHLPSERRAEYHGKR
jgi:hypothetical protein